MKKILLAGALAASMLASSAAFAADLTVGVSEDKLTVTADTNAIMTDKANVGKQMTVVIVDGEGNDVSTETIRYIDQDAAKAGLFSSMGVLLRGEETELPVGKYTVKIGGEDITDLYVGTLEIKADAQVVTDVIKVGDVNSSGAADTTDALGIIAYVLNSANDGSADNKYAIGKSLKVSDSENIVVGDVNNSTVADTTDALSIIAYVLNSANDGSADNKYAVGADVTVIVE